MPQKYVTGASPFRRIRLARGLTMRECSVYAGVSYQVIIQIDRLQYDKIGRLTVSKLLRVAMMLECSPLDLVPFLGTRVKGKGIRGKRGKLLKEASNRWSPP